MMSRPLTLTPSRLLLLFFWWFFLALPFSEPSRASRDAVDPFAINHALVLHVNCTAITNTERRTSLCQQPLHSAPHRATHSAQLPPATRDGHAAIQEECPGRISKHFRARERW